MYVNSLSSKMNKSLFMFFLCHPDTDVAVCQTWPTNQGKKAGSGNYMKLRYVDGQLILTYKHGETCSSGIRRTSIITFYCNEAANQGSPKFNHEDYCNYFFDWPTSLVCPRARKTGTLLYIPHRVTHAICHRKIII